MEDETIATLRQIFRSVDKDGSGGLSIGEITQVMTQLRNGKQPPQDEIVKCFRDMDTDGNGNIDENEFVSAIMKWQTTTSPRAGKRPQDSSPTTESRKKMSALANMTDFFQSYSANFYEAQAKLLSRNRCNLNSENLNCGFQKHTPEYREAYMTSLMATMNDPSFLQNMNTIGGQLSSPDGDQIIEALRNITLLLDVCQVFPSTPDRRTYYFVFDTIFKLMIGKFVDKKSLLDRLVEFVDLSADHDKIRSIQLAGLHCLRIILLGPRVPDRCIWHPSDHVTQHAVQVANAGSFVDRIMNAFRANSIIVENQVLITRLVNCVTAFVDGNEQFLAIMVQLNFRGMLLTYLSQPQAPYTTELLRAVAESLSVFCGHNTLTVDDGDSERNANTISMSETEMSSTLTVTYKLLTELLAGNSLVPTPAGAAPVPVDEPTIIHLVTVYGLLLPLVPMPQLSGNCRPLLDQMLQVLSRPWQSLEAAQITTYRINHAFVDILSASDKAGTAAEWLFTFPVAKQSLKAQLKCGLSNDMIGVTISAIRVIEELLYHDMETEISGLAFETCIALLNNPVVRPYVIDCILLQLVQPKPFFLDMLRKGFVDAVMRDLHKFRLRALLADSSTFGCTVHPTYNTTLNLEIVKQLNCVLEFKRSEFRAADITDAAFLTLQASVFSIEHIDTIRQLHAAICEEIGSGRLLVQDDSNVEELLIVSYKFIGLIKAAHAVADTDISQTIATEVDSLIADWNPLIERSLALAARRSRSSSQSDTADMETADESQIPRKLPYLKSDIGGEQMELLVRPQWSWTDAEGAYKESDKLFLVPRQVAVENLYKCLGIFFGRLLKIGVLNATSSEYNMVYNQDQFAAFVTDMEAKYRAQAAIDPVPKPFRVTIYLFIAGEGELTVRNTVDALQPKDSALRAVQQVASASGIKLNRGLMEKLYEFFATKGVNEINVEQFVECMEKVMQVPDTSSRPLFRAMDTDASGSLSLAELTIGLANLVEGTDEDKIIAAFNAYDADRSGFLEYEEVVNLVVVAKKSCSRSVAAMITEAAFKHLQLPLDGKINLEQFLKLVRDKHLPLDSLLPDIKTLYDRFDIRQNLQWGRPDQRQMGTQGQGRFQNPGQGQGQYRNQAQRDNPQQRSNQAQRGNQSQDRSGQGYGGGNGNGNDTRDGGFRGNSRPQGQTWGPSSGQGGRENPFRNRRN